MSRLLKSTDTVRKLFGKIKAVVPVPDLIEIQSSSFNDFVQLDCLPEERKPMGLHKVLSDVFPMEHEDKLSLEYISYELGTWACACGQLSGIENRYQWTCSSCKKSGCCRLGDDIVCPLCQKKSARYKTCANCLSRVAIKLPMTLEECRSSGQSFAMPLKIKIQLVNWTVDDLGNKVVRDIKEQDIFAVDLPVMADLFEKNGRFYLGNQGKFLINGVDRVVVSQLHRSPGAVFSQSKKVKDFRGRPYYLARIIPMRGSWIDFEFDSNDFLYVRIDKKKKLLATTFLQALGYSRDEIISLFYRFETINIEKGVFNQVIDDSLLGQRLEKSMLPEDLQDAFGGKRVTSEIIAKLHKSKIKSLPLKDTHILNRVIGKDIVDPTTGEVVFEQGQVVTETQLDSLKRFKTLTFKLIQSLGYAFQPVIALTLNQDKSHSQDDALKDLHTKIWPGDSSTLKEIRERLENLLFNNRFYDLTRVGRIRMNRKLNLDIAESTLALTREDVVATIKYLVNLRERGEGELDDIDHLGNRRVRLVGELLNNQMYSGFMRIERIVKERFRTQEPHAALMPQDFLNVKPISAVMREFYGMGQLSQFIDQTNPLAEIAHKRRLSALGPGGVLKDRATFEIRDVHTSHYGRICPIETPEGQTVGLISSLATYAMVNDLGFIETSYRPVKEAKILEEVVFLDAFQEANEYIAQADAADSGKTTLEGKVLARHQGNVVLVDAEQITYIDMSPKQLVSVSAALIPFLEHDDAVRALMGANMQRQAVPLIKPQAPIVATGMEREIGKASGAVLIARRGGVVDYVSSDRIVIRVNEDEFNGTESWVSQGIDTYCLKKFQRSSYSTMIHQAPIVKRGDVVNVGDILTNGASVTNGELSLGSDLLVAFMPWHGYNFEDAVVLNKRLVSEDTLTSVHIEEYDVDARDTKLGPEEITKDIPNVPEIALASLDDDGIVRVGTRVKPGDILVGKVTLKGDVQYSPEEKLLRAIFGEKSREVRDTSLRVPPGIDGTIVDVKILSRGGVRKDKRYKEEVARQIAQLDVDFLQHQNALDAMVIQKAISYLDEQEAAARTSEKYLKKNNFDAKLLANVSLETLLNLKPKDKKVAEELKSLKDIYENQLRILAGLKEERITQFKKGDPLPSGVIKMVKVYIAMKRTVSVGDKIAGRHGNKGVVSNIVAREDMPFMEDGTPVDIVLNPLGVPSRMNVGQILETALGLIGKQIGTNLQALLDTDGYAEIKKYLAKYYGSEMVNSYEKSHGKEAVQALARKTVDEGLKFETPVFDGADFDKDMKPLMADLNLPYSGSFQLLDGRTGEFFDQPVTVGYIHIMKLNHMVDDKLHARSVGPYSLVTQQPLGGKAQQGGQRLGEMEVWALEAYGAAYTLQEMLTYKSDDVSGRHKAYGAIVRGEDIPEPGIPESFNVLVKELQSLGLQVDLLKVGKENIGE